MELYLHLPIPHSSVSLWIASYFPALLCSVCWRKPTLLAEQRWCHHLLPSSWKSNLRQPQTCSQGEVLPPVPSSMPFWPPGLGVSPRSAVYAAFIPHTCQKGTHLSFLQQEHPLLCLPNTFALDHGFELQTPFTWLIPPHLHTFLGFRKDSLGVAVNGGREQQSSCKALPRAASAPCPGVQHCHSTLARWHSLPALARVLQLRASLWQAVRVNASIPCLQLLEQ